MSYIVMGRDECGDDFRPSGDTHHTEAGAERERRELIEVYPECQLWVELYRDKAYYQQQHQQRWEDDEQDLY